MLSPTSTISGDKSKPSFDQSIVNFEFASEECTDFSTSYPRYSYVPPDSITISSTVIYDEMESGEGTSDLKKNRKQKF